MIKYEQMLGRTVDDTRFFVNHHDIPILWLYVWVSTLPREGNRYITTHMHRPRLVIINDKRDTKEIVL